MPSKDCIPKVKMHVIIIVSKMEKWTKIPDFKLRNYEQRENPVLQVDDVLSDFVKSVKLVQNFTLVFCQSRDML